MLLKKITALVNTKLAGDQVSQSDLLPYLDSTIVDINTQLNSAFPLFSELGQGVAEYTAFSDRYIIQVVVPGAAWYYYVADEEGNPAAQQYQLDYKQGLFYIMRDLIYDIPVEYQVNTKQGSAQFSYEAEVGSPGITINGEIGEW